MSTEKLLYWIEERYSVYRKKEAEFPKPWSEDPVFQRTYFCNVHRENDRVTRWVRQHFPTDHPMAEFNMMVARFVNKPSSLETMGWPFTNWSAEEMLRWRSVMSQKGSWGSAYIVSTNGNPVPKHEYISGLLSAAVSRFEPVRQASTLLAAHNALQGLTGLASFMSAQIVADLKNTEGHVLNTAPDWWTFVAPGPGSLRGMAWVANETKVSPSRFHMLMTWLREVVDSELSVSVPVFCNQDLQNCLCEFDKFMRVSNNTGRSKRRYDGTPS